MNMHGLRKIWPPPKENNIRYWQQEPKGTLYPRVRIRKSRYSNKYYVIYYDEYKRGTFILTGLTQFEQATTIALNVRDEILIAKELNNVQC